MKRSLKKNCLLSGFTLVELAIVLTIGGVIIASSSSMLLTYMRESRISETKARLTKIDNAIRQYLNVNGKLPCPASTTAQMESMDFGWSKGLDCNSTTIPGTYALTGRTAPPIPSGSVKLGVVPVRDLNLPDSDMMDGWNNRIVYAVTARLTQADKFKPGDGAIFVKDAYGYPVQLPDGSAQYILISAGENGRGAFSSYGSQQMTGVPQKRCPTSSSYVEYNNCKYTLGASDATFTNAFSVSTTGSSSTSAFDDLVLYNTLPEPQTASADIPSGTVMAFDRNTCPDEWMEMPELRGRVIIGKKQNGIYTDAAPPDRLPINYSTTAGDYNFGESGGYAKWNFTVNELPPHSHQRRLLRAQAIASAGGGTYTLARYGSDTDVAQGWPAGGAPIEIENRQPSIVFLYCQKQ